jgi:streptogrisin C
MYTGYRNATSAVNPTVGMSVCAFGKQTGYNCDAVMALNKCANGYCGLGFMYAQGSVPGDSGGPYFNGTVARGIHNGEVYYNGQWRNIFTRIGIINLLNAVVVV